MIHYSANTIYSRPAVLGDGYVMPHAVTVRVLVRLQRSALSVCNMHQDDLAADQRHGQRVVLRRLSTTPQTSLSCSLSTRAVPNT